LEVGVKVSRAIFSGILGALAMSLTMLLMRNFGINVSLEALLGSLLPTNNIASAWLGGFALHLLIGGVVGLVYAFVFEVAVQRSGPVLGMGLGLAHGLMAGLFMSGIRAMNPLDLNMVSAPGAFLMNLRLGPLVFLSLHCIYGLVVGVAYGPPVQKPHLYSGRPV
jgi:hypothetical protein